jgi:RNA polymerase sigma-70 factor (ECF subfamily)
MPMPMTQSKETSNLTDAQRTQAAQQDASLLVRIGQGDQEALGEFYGRWAPLCIGMGIRMLETREAAEDIVHDVFLEVWHTANQYDPRLGSARTWLLMKLRCRLLDQVRQTARRSRLLTERQQHLEPVAGLTPADDLMHAQLRAAMAQLPEESANLLIILYFCDLSSREAAEALEIPIGTVKSRAASAKRALRQLMETPQAPAGSAQP